MTIRDATIADVPEMVSLGEAFLSQDEIASLGIAATRGSLAIYAAAFIDNEDACALVYEWEGAVVGFILAAIGPHALDAEPVARKASWVMKHAGHGGGLLRAAQAWAASKGAKKWLVSLPNPTPRKAMERLGYRPIETLYQKDLVHGA
jgi:hypothetical protein